MPPVAGRTAGRWYAGAGAGAGIGAGARSVDELLDAAWSDVGPELRPAAAVTLAAHLDKLAAEGRLPDDVQRPAAVTP